MRHTPKNQQPKSPKPTTFTVRQLGKFLGRLNADDVRELVETTDIPHYRVKGHLRFDLTEIKSWLDRNVVPAAGPPMSPDELAALDGDD